MQNLILRKLTLLSFILSLSACATNPPDAPICVEMAPDRGYCTRMISGESFEVDETHPMIDGTTGEKKTWWEMRPIMLQVPPATWAGIKKFIVKICKKTGQCGDAEIASWNRVTDSVDSKLKEKGIKP